MSYDVDPSRLRDAGEIYRSTKNISKSAGLTGWVIAFNRVLNLREQSETELEKLGEGHALPVRSNRTHGFEGPSPLLMVPMRYGDRVIGAIRVSTWRPSHPGFTKDDERQLLAFASELATFLHEEHLLEEGLEHYFRIWSATDPAALARHLTVAVPQLFNVDCCSFFRRDHENRFVLLATDSSEKISADDRKHFERFRQSRGHLYYEASKGSKTGLCIQRQVPLHLERGADGAWRMAGQPEAVDLREEAGGRFFATFDSTGVESCELAPTQSVSLLLVPVRDLINPRMLAGVLRVVSVQRIETGAAVLRELNSFAEGVAHRLAESEREAIELEVVQRMISPLGRLGAVPNRWAHAAQLIAEALDADAATVFVRQKDELRTKAEWSFLNLEKLRRDQPHDVEEHERQHSQFRHFAENNHYELGQGRTGWVALHGKVLRMKDLTDSTELARWRIEERRDAGREQRGFTICEISKPGPLIAAPIRLGPDDRVQGVVRALRCKASPQGGFSELHERILIEVNSVLAALRPIPGGAQIALSYCTRQARLKEKVEKMLRILDFEPVCLESELPKEQLAEAFSAVLRRSIGAIVIATSDEQDDQPSPNVLVEIGAIGNVLPKRWIVLREDTAKLPPMGHPAREVLFRRGEIELCFVELAETLKEWR